jgi:CBS domain-containing membrane protein
VLYQAFAGLAADHAIVRDAASAFAVGAAILAMAITDTEHAPAAGTALGLVIRPGQLEAGPPIILAALILALVKVLLGDRLRDLV